MENNKNSYDVKSIYEELKENLVYPFVSFLPLEVMYETGDKEVVDSINEKIDPFDKPIFAKSSVEFLCINPTTDLSLFLAKSKSLEDNFFALHDYEDTLSEKDFDFLLKRYLETAYTYLFFSQEMIALFSYNQNKSLDKYAYLFEFQDLVFKSHYQDLLRNYSNYTVTEKNGLNILNFMKDEFSNSTPLSNIESQQKETTKPKKSKKEIVVSDKEAKDFLLQNVFHVAKLQN